MTRVVISASLDNLRSQDVRFLEEATRLGDVHVLLWPDTAIRQFTGEEPRFPQAERLYVLESLRYPDRITPLETLADPDQIPRLAAPSPDLWVVREADSSPGKQAFCETHGIGYRVLSDRQLAGFPQDPPASPEGASARRKALVTGCFDWLHSGHVRFFEEVSQLGDLYVVVGHDQNVRLLKGEGHPLFPQEERRYLVGAVRYVTQALISTGHGWMDAEPEVLHIQPDLYVVNEDGDVPEKRAFCAQHGLEYVVLQRTPRPGLPQRESKKLRGF